MEYQNLISTICEAYHCGPNIAYVLLESAKRSGTIESFVEKIKDASDRSE